MKANQPTHNPLPELRLALAEAEELVVRYRQAIAVIEGTVPPHAATSGNDVTGSQRAEATPLRYQPGETMVAFAERVVAAAARPVHLKDILTAVIAGGYPLRSPHSMRLSLARTLDRKVERYSVFTKPGPATYGLIEWRKQHALFPAGEDS